jgi:hypothetical protein
VTALRWLSKRSGHPAEIGEGAALVLGRNAIFDRTSLDDLSLAFMVRVGARQEPWNHDGWCVGLRSDTDLWRVVVDLGGTVRGLASVSMPPAMGAPS